jgi:hypothetical protein
MIDIRFDERSLHLTRCLGIVTEIDIYVDCLAPVTPQSQVRVPGGAR